MKKFLWIMMLLLLANYTLKAQNTHFTTTGNIQFEKTVNMYAMLKKQITADNESYYTPMYEQFKKTQPQFKKLQSTLYFTNNKTLFQPLGG